MQTQINCLLFKFMSSNKVQQKLNFLSIFFFVLFFINSCSIDKYLTYKRGNNKKINHIIHMGQSLGAGEQSLPLVTNYDTGFGNLRFAMGTHTWTYNIYPDKPQLRADSNFYFVPLNAVQRNAEGETIANGMCDHLMESANKQYSIKNRFLFSYAGQGGRYLRELNKRHDDAKDPRAKNRQSAGGYYKTSLDDIKRAKKNANQLNLDYSVFAITWMQGEANGTRKLNRWDSVLSLEEAIALYKRDLIQLKEDYQEDIKLITGQKQKIPFFTYQTAGNLAGIAQMQACDQEDDMYMVGPTYMLPNAANGFYYTGNKLVHGDGIHLTADGERWLGEQFGKVMRKVILEGKSWQPLRPLKAWYEQKENAIYVKFNVPYPPLVVDTAFLPKQDNNLGFSIYNNRNRLFQIKKIEISEKDVLKFSMSDIIPEGDSIFMNYGLLSKVADISQPIKRIKSGVKRSDGHESVEIIFEGNFLNKVALLRSEGVFYLCNKVDDPRNYTNLIIRDVFLDDNGDTVFRGEVSDLRKNISFLIGQFCYTSRRFSYGNIRDSDNEKSTFSFQDNSYGEREGQSYPLYNWCVTFHDLNVITK